MFEALELFDWGYSVGRLTYYLDSRDPIVHLVIDGLELHMHSMASNSSILRAHQEFLDWWDGDLYCHTRFDTIMRGLLRFGWTYHGRTKEMRWHKLTYERNRR